MAKAAMAAALGEARTGSESATCLDMARAVWKAGLATEGLKAAVAATKVAMRRAVKVFIVYNFCSGICVYSGYIKCKIVSARFWFCMVHRN